MIEHTTFEKVTVGHVFWSHGRAWGKMHTDRDEHGNNAMRVSSSRKAHFAPDHEVIIGDWNEAKEAAMKESDVEDRAWANGMVR